MKVLFVSAEVFPYSKVGGLADVAGTLPAELAALGIDVTVITPAYGIIDKQKFNIANSPYRYSIKLGNEAVECSISRWQSPQYPNLQVCFIENEYYFGSRGVYNDSNGNGYSDNAKRFLLFSLASLEICNVLDITPDIIHCNDNHCALIPVFLKVKSSKYSRFQKTKTILTLHNIAYQGVVSMDLRPLFDLPDDLFYPGAPMEWYGGINPLKAGILYADEITTVSPTHAKEIMENDSLAAGLRGVINSTGKRVVGILNGVDYQEWDPEVDRYITKPYSLNSIDDRHYNKGALMNNVGISPACINKPVIGMVSRLVEQKGIALLIESLDRIMQLDIALLILGSGEQEYQTALLQAAERYPEKIYLDFSYNNPLSHQIMAGCDMFLMPSRYEPCGITQMVALKYGSVPIVHKTGGLADTIQDWNGKDGTGFIFENYKSDSLFNAIQRAVGLYSDQKKWKQIMINGMHCDFSWQQSAKQYEYLYWSLIDK